MEQPAATDAEAPLAWLDVAINDLGQVIFGRLEASVVPRHGESRLLACERLFEACAAAVRRLATDREYFPHPARSLYCDVRDLFPLGHQLALYRRIEHEIELATLKLDALLRTRSARRRCRAVSRSGKTCRRPTVTGSPYCPTHRPPEPVPSGQGLGEGLSLS